MPVKERIPTESIQVRLSRAEIARLDDMAHQFGIKRSVMMRQILAKAEIQPAIFVRDLVIDNET